MEPPSEQQWPSLPCLANLSTMACRWLSLGYALAIVLCLWPFLPFMDWLAGVWSGALWLGSHLWSLGGWTWLGFAPMGLFMAWSAVRQYHGRLRQCHVSWLELIEVLSYGLGILGVIFSLQLAGQASRPDRSAVLNCLGPLELGISYWLCVRVLIWWVHYTEHHGPTAAPASQP